MDEQTLKGYIDACELAKEAEKEILKLERKMESAATDKVRGSNPDFPFQQRGFTVSGMGFGCKDVTELRAQRALLEGRRQKAESIRKQTEAWLDGVPMRMQRIIRYRIFEGLTWEAAAARMGRGASGDSLRMEYKRFFRKK